MFFTSLCFLGVISLFRVLFQIPAEVQSSVLSRKSHDVPSMCQKSFVQALITYCSAGCGFSVNEYTVYIKYGVPGGSDGKEYDCNVGDLGSTPGLERSPGEENSYPLQYSCLGNPMDRGTWWSIVHGVAKNLT